MYKGKGVKEMSDFLVKIEYKQKNADGELETVVEKEYDFINYTEMLHLNLMRIVGEIEDAFYYLSGNKQKQDWPPELKDRFMAIRHKLLDQANDIKRLPKNLTHKGEQANKMDISSFVNKTLERAPLHL